MRNEQAATEQPASEITLEPAGEPRSSRAPIAIAVGLTVVSVGAFLGVAFLGSNNDTPASAVEVSEDTAITESLASPTTPPAVRSPVPTPTSATAAPVGKQGNDAAVTLPTDTSNLAQSVAKTELLTSFKMVTVQETGSLSAVFTTTQVGPNWRNRSVLNGNIADGIAIDETVYELDDGTWYLKPLAQRTFDQSLTIEELLNGLAEIDTVELSRSDTTATYELDCSSIGQEGTGFAHGVCKSDLYLTATIDLESGLITTLRAEGDHETWPGVFQDGFSELSIQQVDDREPITAPEQVDTSRHDCIVEEVGASGPELALALNDFLTAENELLYTGCGFSFFPRGIDLDE